MYRISNAYVKNANDTIKKIKISYDINDYNKAKDTIGNIDDELEKRALAKELEDTKVIIDLKQNINDLKTNYSEEKYNKYLNEVNNLDASDIKTELLNTLYNIKNSK